MGFALGSGAPRLDIECSVMAEPELGASFAVHGGGSDLVFPHHENEIAQSEAAGRPFAQVWMHNGMIEADAAKMSKSEGNIFQLRRRSSAIGREAVLAYLISGHYRQPLAFGRADGGGNGASRAAAEFLPRAAAGAPRPGGEDGEVTRRGAIGRVSRRSRRGLQYTEGDGGGIRVGRRGQPRTKSRGRRGGREMSSWSASGRWQARIRVDPTRG